MFCKILYFFLKLNSGIIAAESTHCPREKKVSVCLIIYEVALVPCSRCMYRDVTLCNVNQKAYNGIYIFYLNDHCLHVKLL